MKYLEKTMDKSKQTLPAKENSLFKRILKSYEQKQYKNGLKFAKQILENYPDHGETLAMKGLTLNCLGKKEEAYTFVRLGLRNNLQSHVCWHVFGLLQRSDKKYDEAIKCYRNALKWDKDNLQILRDLSLLQIQMRDLEGYKETRYKLFELRPTQRASWIGYAMSFHLLKDYGMASRILEEFRKTLHKDGYDYEYSELLLYQNMVLREHCQYSEALTHLEKYKLNICDKVTLQELKGEILMKLDRKEEAVSIFRALIARNPENKAYYLSLEKALCLNSNSEKLKLYEELCEKFPRAQVPKRQPLEYASGSGFESLIDSYLKTGLMKGIIPLFTDIKGLYDDPEKAIVIENLALNYLKCIEETGYISPEDDGVKEPAVLLYTLMFLAQHYNYMNNVEHALNLLQSALDHTPTLIELYILKGKILRHAGDLIGAQATLVEAQSLDTADRYVNSKAASYLLNANLVADAIDMCSKFTREDVSAMENLNEMQCMWFQIECARAYFRLKKYGCALKKCHEIDRHFTEIIEDQFDFHTYCMRKMTLRSYVELLRLEDVLRSNKAYYDSAEIAITIYISLYDQPLIEETTEIDTTKLSAAELKKLRNKLKKSKKELEKKKEDKKEHKHKNKNHHNQNEDPEASKPEALIPNKLNHPEDPLAEAISFLKPLQNFASLNIKTHIFAFEIYFRKDKPLLMLQSLKRALNIDPKYPELHICLVRFLKYFQEKLASTSGCVKQVIEEELLRYIKTLDPRIVNEDFINDNQSSLPHRLQAARAMFMLDAVQRERAISIATDLASHLKERTLANLQAVLEWLNCPELNTTPDEILCYKLNCKSLFPRAFYFSSPTDQPIESSQDAVDSLPINSICNEGVNHNHVDAGQS